MKANKLLVLTTLLVLTGCTTPGSSTNGSVELPKLDVNNIEVREMYTNKFGEDKIPQQWTGYGCGDPFVLRYNGKFYLYVSTKNNQVGVLGWESEDLINWKPLNNGENDPGYVSYDECTLGAYAPEVMYFNGAFYMCQSQAGRGHYILKADKPEGPFKAITGNFGESIDGSFFIDDDEQIYFLRASDTGIRMAKLDENNNFAIDGSQKKLDNTQLGGWTEGPYLLKNNGTYYLTYTGNHVLSQGYRVGYSYYKGDAVFNRSSFTQGDFVVLNTDSNFNGLGHSSTVMGPNMDSYYIAYHNLNSTGGPNRSFNISRLFFSGSDMYARNTELENNIAPDMPEFATWDDEFETEDNFALSSKVSKDTFTSEYNLLASDVKCVFAYENENNYHYVSVSADNEIVVKAVKDGSEAEVTSVRLNKSYDYSKLHSLRVTYKDGNLDVYFNNMCKIDDYKVTLKGGKIGYLSADLSKVEYTAFSNYAQGSSDNEEVKQGQSLAANYSSYSTLSNKSKLVAQAASEEDEWLEFNGKEGSFDLLLGNELDRAVYPFTFQEDALYGINIVVDKKYCGKKIGVQLDNGDIYRVTIPSVGEVSGQYVRVLLTEIDITAGAHYISFVGFDEVAFHSFDLFKSSKVIPTFEHSLDTFIDEGALYVNNWKLRDGGHYALESNRQCLYIGDDTLTNYTIECDITLIGTTGTNTAGFIIRGNNPAFSNYDSVSSIQGYYVSFNNSKFTISKCNYDKSFMDYAATADKYEVGTSYHFKIVVNNNTITASIDGQNEITLEDDMAFTHGYFGLYTDGAPAVYKNLKIY